MCRGGGRVVLKHLADVIIWQAVRTRLGPLLGDWLNGLPSWVLGLPLGEQTLWLSHTGLAQGEAKNFLLCWYESESRQRVGSGEWLKGLLHARLSMGYAQGPDTGPSHTPSRGSYCRRPTCTLGEPAEHPYPGGLSRDHPVVPFSFHHTLQGRTLQSCLAGPASEHLAKLLCTSHAQPGQASWPAREQV